MALIRSNPGRDFRALDAGSKGLLEGVGTGAAAGQARPRSGLEGARLEGGRLAALREALGKIEAKSGLATEGVKGPAPLAFGLPEIDRCFPGAGLAAGAVHEVIAASHGDRPAALGFALALMVRAGLARRGHPVIAVSRASLRDFGALYGHGLHQLGLDAGRLILIETRNDKDALWAIEETLRSGAPLSMVLGVLGPGVQAYGKRGSDKGSALADLTMSRRLTLAAASTGTPLVLALPSHAGETSAAQTRWQLAAAPSASGAPECSEAEFRRTRWRASLERCRNGRIGNWLLEWDHVALRFHLASELADHTAVAEPRQGESQGGRLLRFG